MSARNIERKIARTLYEDFGRRWRRELRTAGIYGKPGAKRPSFSQWYEMHKGQVGMMTESTPKDVTEYLGLDPWEEQSVVREADPVEDSDRGVTVINVAGDE